MTKRKLNEKIEIRVSLYEKNKIKYLADLFANGNLSLWVTYAALNAPRINVKPDDLEESSRKNKGPQNNGP